MMAKFKSLTNVSIRGGAMKVIITYNGQTQCTVFTRTDGAKYELSDKERSINKKKHEVFTEIMCHSKFDDKKVLRCEMLNGIWSRLTEE